jgi:hypothetical protein
MEGALLDICPKLLARIHLNVKRHGQSKPRGKRFSAGSDARSKSPSLLAGVFATAIGGQPMPGGPSASPQCSGGGSSSWAAAAPATASETVQTTRALG